MKKAKAAKGPDEEPRSWSAARLQAFLQDAVRILQALEDDDASPSDRAQVVQKARERLAPLTFSPRREPRTEVVEFLHGFLVAPDSLTAAANLLLSGPAALRDADEICVLLELLADAKVDGERLAFQMVDCAALLSLPEAFQSRAQCALVYLAAMGGALPAAALADRLRRTVGLRLPAAIAVLRMTASRQPGLLAAVLRDVRPEFEGARAEQAGSLREAVTDMARRAGVLVFLKVLAQLDPRAHRQLIRAAFSGEQPLFRFEWKRDAAGWSPEGVMQFKEVLMIGRLGAGRERQFQVETLTDDGTWHLDIREISGARVADPVETWTPPADVERDVPAAAFAARSLVAQFAERMTH